MMNSTTKSRSRGKRMLIASGWLLSAVVVVAGIVYGPEFYGLLRVSNEIDRISSDNARMNGPWPRASDACIYCHGFEGNARTQAYPRLAGQKEAYLRTQLRAFASGERSDPTMTPFALSLSEREFESLVTHFSQMTPLPNTSFHGDAARVARGEALAKANNCAACHGQQLEGKDAYPRLAGQGYDYLVDQLTNFRSGTRRDAAGVMAAMAGRLSQRDIEDLAQFIASR
ncbi:c-type cytochrome [Burkholderia sp. Ac-20353]|uniref:c-type cytochrome n=1 Tax=Burkholderia sp. Ac-20353 TaxID=2703894 RepID=UPI00197BA31D|nr:c-type cytochrome [Burkholderia sp. Ac-20353]MBN3786824.1 c-type cytochrome [Burkholderia sp. Ac-20353]